jgi:hypothetical protein
MRRRAVWVSGIAIACAMVACGDLSNPPDGVTSLSAPKLPLPGVVVGDTMRDSTGNVAPITVAAYAANGDTVDAPIDFVTLDSGAHFDGALLVGDIAGRTVRVIGSAAAVQTRPISVLVTLSPDTMVASDSVVHHKTFSLLSGDTIVTSADLAVAVQHLDPSPVTVDAVIVRYGVTRAPPDNGNGPSVVLMNGTTPSERDTTSAGRAARTLRLRLAFAANALADTAEVTAQASYRGHTIGTVRFTVIFTSQ